MEEPQDIRAEAPHIDERYPMQRIARAIRARDSAPEPEVRLRGAERAERWLDALIGMLTGNIAVGSRQPVAGVPVWATLDVATGGFATGRLSAGGELLPHERVLLARIAPEVPDDAARRTLNGWFLTDAGLAELQAMRRAGHLRIEVPEEGALLVVSHLLDHGRDEAARGILAEIAPWFDRLRFYPIPADRPAPTGPRICLVPLGPVVRELSGIAPNPRIAAQQEALTVWNPLLDRFVALFLETVEGEAPDLARGADGRPLPPENGRFAVVGGWPCRTYSPAWPQRGRELVSEFETLRKRHPRCGKPNRREENLPQLRHFAEVAARAPEQLTGSDVGRIRLILAAVQAKRGAADSPRRLALDAGQARQAATILFSDAARVLVPRLAGMPLEEGLDDPLAVAYPVTANEAARSPLALGTAIPASLCRKLERCLVDTVEALVRRGLIPSGETLARVMPQIVGELRAAGIADPELRSTYAEIYRAFRRRRSLLLLNLAAQVKFEELPWTAALDRERRENPSSREVARGALEETILLALGAFPHAILPNKLLQELQTLAQTAEVDLPLTEELAADIFMGEFSVKFIRAAKVAARWMDGTWYAHYFGIERARIECLPETQPKLRWFGGQESPFAALCRLRAGVTEAGFRPAVNGRIIEQQQILTTHNLAVPFAVLGLQERFRDRLPIAAEACFEWICRRLQVRPPNRHAGLIQAKNCAYAWRQMLFFASMLPAEGRTAFLNRAEDRLRTEPVAFRQRFEPAWLGLTLTARGLSLDDPIATAQGARRFLGWSQGPHWLIG